MVEEAAGTVVLELIFLFSIDLALSSFDGGGSGWKRRLLWFAAAAAAAAAAGKVVPEGWVGVLPLSGFSIL